MISFLKKNEYLFNVIILPTVVFLSICFSFIATNINRSELNIQSLMLVFVVFECVILFFYVVAKWLNPSVRFLRGLSFFGVSFFILQWYYVSIDLFIMHYDTGALHKLLLLFFFFVFTALLSFTVKNNFIYRFFVSFCLIFFVLTFGKLIFAILTKPVDFNNNVHAAAKALPYKAHSSKRPKNIYYFVTDELGSEQGLQQGNVDITFIREFQEELIGKGFTILGNNLSSYNLTYLSLQSIFDMDYPVDEQSSRYNNAKRFYSSSLKEKNESLLERQLKVLGYEKFIYFGNIYHNCNSLRKNIICGMNLEKSFIKNILMDYTLNKFIETSLFKSIVGRLEILLTVHRTDTLKYVFEYLQLNKQNDRPQFLFAHVMMPHEPFYTKTCKPDDREPITGLDNKFLSVNLLKRMYSNSIKCLENQLIPILKFILKQDPTAIIIVQGDHGSGFYYKIEDAWYVAHQPSKMALNERFSAFNAIKMPSSCLVNLPKSLGNVNTIRLALACAAGIKPKLLEEKHLIAYSEWHQDFGKVSPLEHVA